jgi:hypothetical protein
MSETTPSTEPHPKRGGIPTLAKSLIGLMLVAVASAIFWNFYGYKIWAEYKILRTEIRASSDSAPVGYIGLNYRRSYNDRPVLFETEKDGKKLLFAAKLEGGAIDYYDISEADAAFDVKCLEGGFGRDSIAGVDYPIIETPGNPKCHALRERQPVFGLAMGGAIRAYPQDLIEKSEVINDRLGGTDLAIVYDRSRRAALVFDRKLRDGAITFGTTGYSCKLRPLLYDRKTKGLWLLQGDNLACLNGPHKGEVLAPIAKPEAPTWADWLRQNRKTTVLVGNDRKQPIPSE